ncbi:alpha/beta hydrolase [Verrucosispora sp. WMMC514]|uniref:alpha/beta hydrolase n=1 Tax=Verrucosispora sp. WMMC514 TaxID=3015156 RepID=UPI00248D0742|nr:alpha/beta hydrolase [Verrucosispora sp. WMMC514]WBB91321.1 alpha/beta hydrolase [Verrucosispora sp. WMMC514]
MKPALVLLHSLLLGPVTWAPVAARLRALDAAAVVPSLVHVAAVGEPPFWPGVAAAVSDSVSQLPDGQPIVLVAHSNAGLVVPAVVPAAGRPVVGCLFVDASLPSRSGPTPAASPERLAYLRSVATEGRLPQWTTWWEEEAVASLLPDPRTRSMVSAEQPRLPLSYYEQQFPVPAGWDDRPCGYLLFGPPYDRMAQESRTRGWSVAEVPGGHLHQLVDPDAVTARILTITARWGSAAD